MLQYNNQTLNIIKLQIWYQGEPYSSKSNIMIRLIVYNKINNIASYPIVPYLTACELWTQVTLMRGDTEFLSGNWKHLSSQIISFLHLSSQMCSQTVNLLIKFNCFHQLITQFEGRTWFEENVVFFRDFNQISTSNKVPHWIKIHLIST